MIAMEGELPGTVEGHSYQIFERHKKWTYYYYYLQSELLGVLFH